MNYTQYVTKLIAIIVADGTPADEIALTEKEIIKAHESSITPEQLYYKVWERDAGNYWAI